MSHLILVMMILGVMVHSASSQTRYLTREGHVSFYSNAPLEKIEAHARKAAGVLESSTGNFQAAVLMKSFLFEKDLMQQHFNESYVESHKFPKATFKGRVDNIAEVDFSRDGVYPVRISGKMEIHGVTHDITVPGTLIIKRETVTARSEFIIKPEDYNIRIPKLVRDNIAREVNVIVEMKMNPLTAAKE